MHLQGFIALKLMKEEGTVAIIKDDQPFHQRHIFIKMCKPHLILLRMVYSHYLHRDKLRLMVLMVDDHIRMSMPDINNEYYPPPVI